MSATPSWPSATSARRKPSRRQSSVNPRGAASVCATSSDAAGEAAQLQQVVRADPALVVERRRQRRRARVLDAVGKLAVVEHASQRGGDVVARHAQRQPRSTARAGRRRRGTPRPARTRAPRPRSPEREHRGSTRRRDGRRRRARPRALELVGELLGGVTDSTASAAIVAAAESASSSRLERAVVAPNTTTTSSSPARSPRPARSTGRRRAPCRRARGARGAGRQRVAERGLVVARDLDHAGPAGARPLPPKCTNRLPVTRRRTNRSHAPTDAGSSVRHEVRWRPIADS